jgi:hypothetical protein
MDEQNWHFPKKFDHYEIRQTPLRFLPRDTLLVRPYLNWSDQLNLSRGDE